MYCEPSEVRLLIHTGLTGEQLGLLIVSVDADIDDRLGTATLSDALKKLCSMLLTAVLAAERDPSTYAVGVARIQYGDRIEDWKARADRILKKAKGIRISYWDDDEEEVVQPS